MGSSPKFRTIFILNYLFISPSIEVISEGNVLGVFAAEDIKKGSLIERSFCIFLDEKWENCDKSLKKHCFGVPFLRDDASDFAEENGGVTEVHVTRPVIVTGYGVLYNSSKDFNVDWDYYYNMKCIAFKAAKKIKKGEELLIKGE